MAATTSFEDVSSLELLAQRVDDALSELNRIGGEPLRYANDLKEAIEEFHKSGLRQIIQHLKADEHGRELLYSLLDDPQVYAMFSMHGLIRPPISARVSRVIETVRPYIQSHGGDVELVEVTHDTVRVRLNGSCRGCSMSAVTLRNTLEESIREHVPEITSVESVVADPGPALIPLQSLTAGNGHGWIDGPPLAALEEAKPYRLEMENGSILILRLGEQLQAFNNRCAHLGLPLDGGMVDAEAGTITCPWHGFRFDCLSGECLTAPHAQLDPLPLRVENGIVKVRPK